MNAPKRWCDDLEVSDSLRQALVGLSEEVPTEAAQARIQDGVLSQFDALFANELDPAGSSGPPAEPSAALAQGSLALGKIVVGLAVGSLILGGGYAASRRFAGAPSARLDLPHTPSLPEPAVALAPSLPVASRGEASPRELAATETQVTKVKPKTSDLPSGKSEVELLLNLRSSLKKSPSDALALCYEHQRLFPRGRFVEERDAMLVEALFLVGRREEAKSKFAAFKRARTESVYLERLTKLLRSPSSTSE
jgi:hypothetical protein